jgi:hypothetical protein
MDPNVSCEESVILTSDSVDSFTVSSMGNEGVPDRSNVTLLWYINRETVAKRLSSLFGEKAELVNQNYEMLMRKEMKLSAYMRFVSYQRIMIIAGDPKDPAFASQDWVRDVGYEIGSNVRGGSPFIAYPHERDHHTVFYTVNIDLMKRVWKSPVCYSTEEFCLCCSGPLKFRLISFGFWYDYDACRRRILCDAKGFGTGGREGDDWEYRQFQPTA